MPDHSASVLRTARWLGAVLLGVIAVVAACAWTSAAQFRSASQAARLERLMPDLPLAITPAAAGAGRTFVVFISGDGGWGGFDRQLARKLAASGMPVVGWDARRYFGAARTPASSAADLGRVIDAYSARFRRDRVLLVGFSFGANAVPYMTEQLPDALRQRIAGVALISPTAEAQFQFSPLDWLMPPAGGLPVAPAVARLDPARTLCIYGRHDASAICPHLPAGVAQTLSRPGGHHLDGGDDALLVRAVAGLAGQGTGLASKRPRIAPGPLHSQAG